jgi:hypothetical protein
VSCNLSSGLGPAILARNPAFIFALFGVKDRVSIAPPVPSPHIEGASPLCYFAPDSKRLAANSAVVPADVPGRYRVRAPLACYALKKMSVERNQESRAPMDAVPKCRAAPKSGILACHRLQTRRWGSGRRANQGTPRELLTDPADDERLSVWAIWRRCGSNRGKR